MGASCDRIRKHLFDLHCAAMFSVFFECTVRVEFCAEFCWFGKKLRKNDPRMTRRGGNAFAKPVSSLARSFDRASRRNSAIYPDMCYNGGMMMNMPD